MEEKLNACEVKAKRVEDVAIKLKEIHKEEHNKYNTNCGQKP